MAHKKKISVALLGKEIEPKMYLANLILGKDKDTDKTVAAVIDRPKKDISDSDPYIPLVVINKNSRDAILEQIDQLETTSQNPYLIVLPLHCLQLCSVGEPAEDPTRHLDPHAGRHEAESTRGTVNIILLGQTGTGKSACGNTILGKTQFQSEVSASPVTKKCQSGDCVINSRRVNVIDTPDYDEVDMQTKTEHVKDCNTLLQPGPCVYLLVMQLGRCTDGERDLEKAFSQEIREKTIILFTHGERLKPGKTSLKAFVDRNVDLKDIVKQCGDRYHVFQNNKIADRKQVDDLMQMVCPLIGQEMEGHTSDGRKNL